MRWWMLGLWRQGVSYFSECLCACHILRFPVALKNVLTFLKRFPRGKKRPGPDADQSPPHLVSRSWMSRAIYSLPPALPQLCCGSALSLQSSWLMLLHTHTTIHHIILLLNTVGTNRRHVWIRLSIQYGLHGDVKSSSSNEVVMSKYQLNIPVIKY
jgi:hypothetical protein